MDADAAVSAAVAVVNAMDADALVNAASEPNVPQVSAASARHGLSVTQADAPSANAMKRATQAMVPNRKVMLPWDRRPG